MRPFCAREHRDCVVPNAERSQRRAALGIAYRGLDAVAGAVGEIDARDIAVRGALFEQPRNGHILVVLMRKYEKDAQR